MQRRLLPLAFLAWALTPTIEAQPGSAYYGASIGEFDYSDRAAGLGGVFNDSVDSWRVTIGYQLFEHFAFEGNYGKTSTVRDTVSGPPPGSTAAPSRGTPPPAPQECIPHPESCHGAAPAVGRDISTPTADAWAAP